MPNNLGTWKLRECVIKNQWGGARGKYKNNPQLVVSSNWLEIQEKGSTVKDLRIRDVTSVKKGGNPALIGKAFHSVRVGYETADEPMTLELQFDDEDERDEAYDVIRSATP